MGGLQIALTLVKGYVLGLSHDLQVAPVIVTRIAVDMVDNLIGAEHPAKMLFGDQAMFRNVSLRVGVRMIRAEQVNVSTAHGAMRGLRFGSPLHPLSIAAQRTEAVVWPGLDCLKRRSANDARSDQWGGDLLAAPGLRMASGRAVCGLRELIRDATERAATVSTRLDRAFGHLPFRDCLPLTLARAVLGSGDPGRLDIERRAAFLTGNVRGMIEGRCSGPFAVVSRPGARQRCRVFALPQLYQGGHVCTT